MDKPDIETDTETIENPFDFSKLSGDKKIVEKFTFCETKDVQM